MELYNCNVNETYIIEKLKGDDEINKFLFSLGCYKGEKVTILSKLAGSFIVNIKDSRYGIDEKIAKSIEVKED